MKFNRKQLLKLYIDCSKFYFEKLTEKNFIIYLFQQRDFNKELSPYNIYLHFIEFYGYFQKVFFQTNLYFEEDENLKYIFISYKSIHEIDEEGRYYIREHPVTGQKWVYSIDVSNFSSIVYYLKFLKDQYLIYSDLKTTGRLELKYTFPLPRFPHMFYRRQYSLLGDNQ